MNALSSSKLNSAIAEKKARLDYLIRDNQVYRFAARVYGYDDPTEMTAKELNTFCFVWFGLIAFAVSTLGPLLALCYYRIKFQTAVGRTASSRLLHALRRLVLRLARRNKIIKIQEVEKIIERSVEVPVEVVREVEKEVPVERVVTVVQEVVKEVPVDRIVPVEKPVEVMTDTALWAESSRPTRPMSWKAARDRGPGKMPLRGSSMPRAGAQDPQARRQSH